MASVKNGNMGKNGEAGESKVPAGGSGMIWLGVVGALLVLVLAASVHVQSSEVKTTDSAHSRPQVPRETFEVKTTTAQPRAKDDVTTSPAPPTTPEVKTTTAQPRAKEHVTTTVTTTSAAPPKKKTRPKTNPFELHIPRMTLAELHKNDTLRSGHYPFVLTDIINKSWKATSWTLRHLKEKIPFEWVDYYPENMKNIGNKPYLQKLENAIQDFMRPSKYSKYMQMRISLRGWKRIRKDLDPMPDHPTFWDDGTWIRHCMSKSDGKPDEKAIDNFFTTNQWKFLLIGQKGTSMFFHKDTLAATSWQAQIKGRKMWTLCPVSETRYLSEEIDTYNPDYKRFPNFAKALCGQVTVHPGEMVYYPAYMWHHASQLDTPTISYTGLLVGTEADRHDLGGGDKKVHRQMYRDLMRKCAQCWTPGKKQRHCDDISLKWPGAAPPPLRDVCDKYLPKCLKLWDKHSDSLWMNKTQDSTSQEAAELGEFD
mmetsp:Transcript_65948/g.121669  ORF Transcript_65948/g.121669 Transcript_65948/m.121669 type:complete len:481 (+) Transcript_65948:146-1588(+)